jgi:DNA polymerase-1
MKTYLLVDGDNLMMRAIHAASHTSMSSHGVATGGLHIFVRSLTAYIRRTNPDGMIVLWDAGHEHRTKLHDGYKAQRGKRDPSFADQFDLAQEFLAYSNIAQARSRGWEADDLIAWIWFHHQPVMDDERMVILSGDKDLLQLVGPGVTQIRPASNVIDDLWDEGRVYDNFGCTPEQLPWVMALMGDATDGVDGVPKVGPVRARQIFESFDFDHEKMMQAMRDDSGDLPTLLIGQHELVERNFALIDLRELPVRVNGIVHLSPSVPKFMPTRYSDDSAASQALLDFLRRYDLSSVEDQLVAGTLWGISGSLVESQ